MSGVPQRVEMGRPEQQWNHGFEFVSKALIGLNNPRIPVICYGLYWILVSRIGDVHLHQTLESPRIPIHFHPSRIPFFSCIGLPVIGMLSPWGLSTPRPFLIIIFYGFYVRTIIDTGANKYATNILLRLTQPPCARNEVASYYKWNRLEV